MTFNRILTHWMRSARSYRCPPLPVRMLFWLSPLFVSLWAADAPYLPSELSFQELDSAADHRILELGQMTLAKLMLKPGSIYALQPYWTDNDWGFRHYLPLGAGAGGTTTSYALPVDPTSGSHLELSASFRAHFSGSASTQGHHHLLAARFENLSGMSGYYPHDFESKICLYEVKRDFSQAYPQRFLNLLQDNPHLGTAHRVRPATTGWPQVQEAYNQEAVVSPVFKVASSVASQTSKLDGYDGGLDGDVEMALDGLLHTAYRSAGVDPRVVVDLGGEYPVDRIVIRWEGDTAQDYRLYTFKHNGQHKSIAKIQKLFAADKVDSDKHLIYRGGVNAVVNEAVIHRPESAIDLTVENNNTASGSDWIKTRSHYAPEPNLLSLSEHVTEVVQLPAGSSAGKVRFVVFEGISKKGEDDEYLPFTIRELEIYGYPVKRHQCGTPRLFNYKENPWLLYDSTLSGRPVDPVLDGGLGRSHFMARIGFRSDRRGDGSYGPNYFVHMDASNQATIRRLQLPTGSANSFLPAEAPPPDCLPLPFEGQPDGAHAGKLFLVYDLNPFTVYEVDPASGQLSERSQSGSNLMELWGQGMLGEPIRGTPAIWDAARQQYLCAFQSRLREPYTVTMGTHTVQRYRTRDYLGLLAFEERSDGAFQLAAVTPEPLLQQEWYPDVRDDGSRELLPCGLAADPDVAGSYRLSLGVAGQQVQVTQLSAAVFDEMIELEPNRSTSGLEPLDVFVVLGLSNAAGRAPLEAQDQWSSDAVYLWNADHAWEPFSEPANQYSTIQQTDVLQQLGPAGSFVRTLLGAPGNGDKKIGLVVNARGGGSLREWLKPGDNRFEGIDSDGVGRYENTLARIQEALKEGVGHQLKGILILAGEGDLDNDDDASAYSSVFEALVDDLRLDGFANPKLPVVTAILLQDANYSSELSELSARELRKTTLNREIAALDSKDPALGVVADTLTTMRPVSLGDGMHYNAKSMRMLGLALAEAMDGLAYPSTEGGLDADKLNYYYALRLEAMGELERQSHPVWTPNPLWSLAPVYDFDPASIPELSTRFEADPDQDYGYDDWTDVSRPWKSVAVGKDDTVLAQVQLGLADSYSDLSFRSADDTIATVTAPTASNAHQQIALTVTGVAQGDTTVQAAVEEVAVPVAGDRDLQLAVYPTKSYTVSVQSAYLPKVTGSFLEPSQEPVEISKAKLQERLNAIYQAAAIEFDVTVLDPIEVPYDLDYDNALGRVNNDEQQILLDNCRDESYDYNVIVVGRIGTTGYSKHNVVGFAPIGGRIAIVDSASVYGITPHELGHCLGLRHDSDDDLNLMFPILNLVFHPQERLLKYQWDIINP